MQCIMMLKSPFYFASRQSASASPRAAVLLLNIGTPDAPTPAAVRRYLAEFLSDPRVIEAPRWLWWCALHGVILRIRPARSARAYQKIWTSAGSPLRVEQEKLVAELATQLHGRQPQSVIVKQAMRYGNPSVAMVLKELIQKNVQRLLVLPLYPQYSASATGSAFDAVTDFLQKCRWPPELRFINGYHAEPEYIEALAQSVEKHWHDQGRGERLVLSFHGIPERYVAAGDPYFQQCQTTTQLLRTRLELSSDQLLMSFQSRVGKETWLQPYTKDLLKQSAQNGVRHVQVLCPGFAVDCLETLEEIAMEARADFLTTGGERFDYIGALNSGAAHVRLLLNLISRHTQGWPEFDAAVDQVGTTAERFS